MSDKNLPSGDRHKPVWDGHTRMPQHEWISPRFLYHARLGTISVRPAMTFPIRMAFRTAFDYTKRPRD